MAVQTMPILPSWDFDATASFYHALGFEERTRYADYLILVHSKGIELHFLHCSPFPAIDNDHGAYVRFSTASEHEDVFRSWSAADLGHGKLTEPEDMSYGLREFTLLDPMHNQLRVGGPINS